MVQKTWRLKSQFEHELLVDDALMASLNLKVNTSGSVAQWSVGERKGIVRYKGFWRGEVVMLDEQGNTVLSAKPMKWYGTTQEVSYNGRVFHLHTRNNPLAELCLQENDVDLIAYSLETTHRKVGLRIRQKSSFHDPLLDVLLWYLFHPIAQEQAGMDVATFLLLVS